MSTTKRAVRCQAKNKTSCRIHGTGSYLQKLVDREHEVAQSGNVEEYLRLKEEIDKIEKNYAEVETRQEAEMEREMRSATTPDPHLVKSRWQDEDTQIEHNYIQDQYDDSKEGLQAQLDAAGGVSEFPALFDLEGKLIPAKLIDTQYGQAWAILSSEDHTSPFSGNFFSQSQAKNEGTRVKNNAKKGYYIGTVRAPGFVREREVGGYYQLFKIPYIAQKYVNFDSDEIEVTDNGKF